MQIAGSWVTGEQGRQPCPAELSMLTLAQAPALGLSLAC